MPVARSGFTRRKSDVSATPTQLTPVDETCNTGVQVLASPDNAETIYVGYSSAITANEDDLTDGFPLVPGAAFFFPCRHPGQIWVRSTAVGSQVVWYLGV